jgi:uncharacterized protein (DUF2384 family)
VVAVPHGQTAQVVTALLDVYNIDGARIWLFSPNPLLEGRKPIDLIDTDEGDRVLQVIDGLASGVM